MPDKNNQGKNNQDGGFALQPTQKPEELTLKPKAAKKPAARDKGKAKTAQPDEAAILSYRHGQKRKNNPDVGVVTPETDPEQPRTKWAYDPHLSPELQFDSGRAQIEQLIDDALASGNDAAMRAALEALKRRQSPYLNWSGKAERTSFDVDTVSLHVHERIDPMSILSALRKDMKLPSPASGRGAGGEGEWRQAGLFAAPFENLPLRDAVDFYKHEKGWSNRLVSGDSLLVMNSLLQKESMAGQVQTIYLDPPYGIKYGSNFQPFTNKRDVKDRQDADLTQEPEMIKAFRDTWELGIHSYLTYLRDRLLLAKELLHESGSVFVQISDENVHLVRNLLDEVFGTENFVRILAFRKTGAQPSEIPAANYDFIVWYARSFGNLKSRPIFTSKDASGSFVGQSLWIEDENYLRRPATKAEKENFPTVPGVRFFVAKAAQGAGSSGNTEDFELWGKIARPGAKKHWSTTPAGMVRLSKASRLVPSGSTARFVWFFDDFPLSSFGTVWDDTVRSGFGDTQVYVVETNALVIERCLLMTTDPGDLVLDPTCGSGTTAFVAEKWGRRWITCDTSRVAVTLAKQRLMTASYDYFELRYPHEGLKGGFIYKTVPHVTLKSIANNPDIDTIYERMHPAVERALGALNAALPPSPAGGRGAGGEGDGSAQAANNLTSLSGRGAGGEGDGSAQAANNLTSLSGRGAGGEGDGSEYIPNPPAQLPEELLRHAREMRKGATDAEHLLWQLLRDRRLANAKFRRQHTIGNYIVDFYCDAHRLVIELDGGQHAEQQSYDAARTAFLEKQGLTVLRYWNNQVLGETEPVLQDIWRHVGGATLTPIPLPPAGEGLREWEVPFDFPADWPEAARSAFDAFHAAQQAMQKQMDLSIAAHADQEILYDQPQASKNKRRITGPFSVEAVPFPSVKGLDALSPGLPSPQPLSQGERGYVMEADASIARSGESARQHTWRDELLKTGIRGKGGQMLKFAELETLPGTKYLHCTGTLVEPVTSLTPGPSPACGRGESMRVVVSFGPEHAALEQRQVEMAMREAGELFPRPKMIVFCAFTFDPEAAKDIDQTKGITALKAQMNTDLLTDDLKKARSSNQSFWLMGQPDVEVRKLPSPPAPLPKGEGSNNWYTVEVHGFDYFDTAKGELVSGGKGKIAMWLLDTDYDERSLFPRQVFFPMAGKGEGWQKLKKDIKAELNEDLLEQFHGTTSLPFAAGENRKIAVKIIDDRGIESLKVVTLEDGK